MHGLTHLGEHRRAGLEHNQILTPRSTACALRSLNSPLRLTQGRGGLRCPGVVLTGGALASTCKVSEGLGLAQLEPETLLDPMVKWGHVQARPPTSEAGAIISQNLMGCSGGGSQGRALV